jgi:hypothetical protein
MPEALPADMVAQLDALGRRLMAWTVAHPDASLALHEQAVLSAVRATLPRLLETVLQRSTSALAPPQRRLRYTCPTCARRLRARRWARRQVRTVCGPIRFTRPWYVCPSCQRGWSPADAALGLAPRARLSVGVERWLWSLGASVPFAEASRRLAQLTGLAVSAETVRQHSEQQGAALEAQQQAEATQVLRTREPAGPVVAAPGQLLVETDGVMVRFTDGWHEVKVGVVAGWDAGRVAAPSYVAARETAEQFGPRLLAAAVRRGALAVVGWEGGPCGAGLAQLRAVAVLGDGALWIWELASEQFGDGVQIVDFYHAAEHLGTLAQELATGAVATAWASTQIARLKAEGGAAVLASLGQLRALTPEGAETLRRTRGYFRTNQARMDYPAFRAQGLPIGSGAVESAAHHLVQLRFKRPGMRWSVAGGRTLLALRAQVVSDDSLAA